MTMSPIPSMEKWLPVELQNSQPTLTSAALQKTVTIFNFCCVTKQSPSLQFNFNSVYLPDSCPKTMQDRTDKNNKTKQANTQEEKQIQDLKYMQTFQPMHSQSGCVSGAAHKGMRECHHDTVGGRIQTLHKLKHHISKKCFQCANSYR